MKQARRLAAYAYTIGSETLASAALVLAKRKPKDRKALQLAALTKGVPFRIYIDGVLFERITDDDTGAFLTDDDTGLPLYDEVA